MSHCVSMSIYDTVHARHTNVMCHDARIDLITILMFQKMCSPNQISITTCLMPHEKLIEAVCCFPCLWQVSNKSYKDARAREKAWKEVTEANIMTTI